MKMKKSLGRRSGMAICVAMLVLIPAHFCRAAGPAPAGAPVSPFDKDDPEIQRIRALDWKNADLAKLDQRSRCMAYFALNRGLTAIGAKADARLDLLIDYIEDNNLDQAIASDKQAAAEPPVLTFDTMMKVAAAFIASDLGKAKFEKEFAQTSDAMLPRYESLYEKSSRRAYEEAADSRYQVRVLAGFLVRQGKFDEFKKWAAEEKKRRQAEFMQEVARKRSDAQAAEKERREKAQAAADERREKEAELAARQVEYAIENQGGGGDDNYSGGDWGDIWYGWGTGYYDNSAYRAAVRDKAGDSWRNWNSGRPANRPARARRR